jgi:hypothetical protein
VEAVAWLIVSERAGPVSAALSEIAADACVAGIVKEYSDAYGRTFRHPLYTPAAVAELMRQMVPGVPPKGTEIFGITPEWIKGAEACRDETLANIARWEKEHAPAD